MGGPSQRTEQRRAYLSYTSAVRRIHAAMQRVRELAIVIEPGPLNRPPHGWTREQREAVQDAAFAWYDLVMQRRAYESVWDVSHPRDWE